ncbi:MAG: hypothetical protein IJ880_07835 [Bacilli bacterium]|nr:hypothetical protein [Bacilli bacterium]
MEYTLKYNPETLELIGIEKAKEEKRGFIENENTIYIPCKSKVDALNIYKSILRENINYLKNKKRKINDKLATIKNMLQEIESNEK